MPYTEVPAFVTRLRERQATSALALEFLILTASRASEVLGGTWGEVDLKERLWTVPASRMKRGQVHRVPLSERAVEILQDVALLQQSPKAGARLFPGSRAGTGLSNMAFARLLDRMGETGFVPHGFRSSFRDWCGDATSVPREVAEAALSHAVGDETERAYRRGDALQKRRQLMDEWCSFVCSTSGREPS